MNKEKYPQLKRKLEDFLINTTKVENKEYENRILVIEDFVEMIDDIHVNFLDLGMILEDIRFSLQEAYPEGKIINAE